MKTEIWNKTNLITVYEVLITMSSGDVVLYNGIEYEVDCCLLNVDEGVMVIYVL